jgi:hypothetical protein
VLSVRLLIIVACASTCSSAQPAAPPKILALVRQQFKSGQAHTRERLERATSAAYNRLDIPFYWMELEAFTGTPEALLFEPFDSFEAVEKTGAILGPFEEAHPELARWEAGINDALSSQRTILAVRRDSPGVDGINLAQARLLRMLVVRTNPGDAPPAIDGPAGPAIVYDVNSGMEGPAFLIFLPMATVSDIPSIHITVGTIVEDSVYAIVPEMSHISRAFAQQDQTFWTKPPDQK